MFVTLYLQNYLSVHKFSSGFGNILIVILSGILETPQICYFLQ